MNLRKTCFDCREGGRFGNAAGGRRSRKCATPESHAGTIARSVRAKCTMMKQLEASEVLYLEVWADINLHISRIARRECSFVLRVGEPSNGQPVSDNIPKLAKGIVTTIFVDVDSRIGRRTLESWICILFWECKVKRVVVCAPPCSRMHCRLQPVNISKWKRTLTASRFRQMAVFLQDCRRARSTVVFAWRLRTLVDSANENADVVHEQPSTTRMAPLSTRADCLVDGIWPAVWPLDAFGDMSLFPVGYGDARKSAFYSVTLAYYLAISARCTWRR